MFKSGGVAPPALFFIFPFTLVPLIGNSICMPSVSWFKANGF